MNARRIRVPRISRPRCVCAVIPLQSLQPSRRSERGEERLCRGRAREGGNAMAVRTEIGEAVPEPLAEDAGVPPESLYRLSVEQYHAMAREGILTDDDPVELLEGLLVCKMTKYRPHSLATGLLR